MTILYLYTELMGYQIPVLKEYVSKYDADVHVVHWDHKKLTPYIPPVIENVTYYNRSNLDYSGMIKLVEKINPNIIFVSGWMDKKYLKIAAKFKNKNIPVVVGSDTQWESTFRKNIASIIFKYTYKKCFTHIWVSGPFQYEYAKKLGFTNNEIIFNLYTADVDAFSENVKKTSDKKYSKNFLFLGRLEEIKGISCLLQAWESIVDKKGWTLTFMGNGSLKTEIEKSTDVVLKNFMQPNDLINEIQKYGFLILPSLKEPWALVIHEAMSAGLPVLASDVCGAGAVFIVPNYTGYTFKSNNVEDLKSKIKNILNMTEVKLNRMSDNALERSKVITPEIVAASFMSVLK